MKSRHSFALLTLWAGCSVASFTGSSAASEAGPVAPVRTGPLGSTLAVAGAGVVATPAYVIYAIPQINTNQNIIYGLNSYHQIAGGSILPPVQLGGPTKTYGLLGGANLGGQLITPPQVMDEVNFVAINDAGIAVGSAHEGRFNQPIVQRAGQALEAIFTVTPSRMGGKAIAINHAGVVIGTLYEIPSNDNKQHNNMFRYDTTTHTVTGTWADTAPGAINESGLLALSPENPYITGQKAQINLQTAPGVGDTYYPPANFKIVRPNSMSTAGGVVVIGDAFMTTANGSNTALGGFLFNQSTKGWFPLVEPSGHNWETHAIAVDYWGQTAVGYTWDIQGHYSAVMWKNPGDHTSWKATPLHTVLGDPAGWSFDEANAINPFGAIAGYGFFNGKETAFIAVPSNFFGFEVSTSSIRGGETIAGTLKTKVGNPFPLTFHGASSNAAATIPAVVSMAAGGAPVTFSIPTKSVDVTTVVALSIKLDGISQTMNVTVTPAQLSALAATPSVVSGPTTTGTVTLNGPAGPSGTVVHIVSSDPAVSVPATVKVAPGASTATFTIAVGNVATLHTAQVTATAGSASTNATLTIGTPHKIPK